MRKQKVNRIITTTIRAMVLQLNKQAKTKINKKIIFFKRKLTHRFLWKYIHVSYILGRMELGWRKLQNKMILNEICGWYTSQISVKLLESFL